MERGRAGEAGGGGRLLVGACGCKTGWEGVEWVRVVGADGVDDVLALEGTEGRRDADLSDGATHPVALDYGKPTPRRRQLGST